MGLNDTPSGERIYISFFGKRNAGKSSLVNAITGQEISIVSDVKGTTTDPVYKSMELLPLGPVMIVDTPGIDDEGTLGEQRIKRTKQVLDKTDVAVLVVDSSVGMKKCDENLISLFIEKNIKYIVALNKCELSETSESVNKNSVYVSAVGQKGINKLKEKIVSLAQSVASTRQIVGDLISPSDFVMLVTPIDKAAPKGRLILPQQQTIRNILDTGAASIVVRETEFEETIKKLGKKPSLVITDSQVFEKIASETPDDIYLTSFSILMTRYKGFLGTAIDGVKAIERLRDGDTILIAEGCTHHRQCDDIGTVKIPKWLKHYTGKHLCFETSSGTGFPNSLKKYSMVIHCGGCMLNEREIFHRMQRAQNQGVPITNYGIAIAHMKGILKRSLEIFHQYNIKI